MAVASFCAHNWNIIVEHDVVALLLFNQVLTAVYWKAIYGTAVLNSTIIIQFSSGIVPDVAKCVLVHTKRIWILRIYVLLCHHCSRNLNLSTLMVRHYHTGSGGSRLPSSLQLTCCRVLVLVPGIGIPIHECRVPQVRTLILLLKLPRPPRSHYEY